MSRARTTITFAVTSLFVLGACARRNVVSQRTTVTSAAMQSGYREAQQAAEQVTLGKYTEALARADNAVRLAPNNPWALYNRAVALHHLGRADSAVSAYRDAEARFGQDVWGKSLAIYGRARVLNDVGRCDEARSAYGEFAALVRPTDAPAADMALAYAKDCQVPLPSPSAADAVLTEMATALASGQYAKVLELNDKLAPKAEANPWLDYNLGAALTGLGRTDDAVAAFVRAEAAFGEADPKGRGLAIWGRARALETAGRCREANQAFDEYARVVGAADPGSVRMAFAYGGRCK